MTRSLAVAHLEQGSARLDVRRALHLDPEWVCRALADPVWLGHELAAGRPTAIDAGPDDGLVRRIETDLALPLGGEGRVVTFRKAALVDIGAEESTVTGCRFEVAWQAASFAPLFPVFAGQLAVGPGALRLRGAYAPPGGAVGLVIDRAILHHVAWRTAGWFLDRLLERAEVTARWDARPS
ncbi:MAG TPA: hypothetical protein VFW92_09780 [Candidatus Limnocylindrales bacterium]|nr:hypothetical protein [Candidatus Limnocylindrales bacterium]